MSAPAFTPGPWQVAGVRHSGDLRIGRDTRLHFVGPDDDAVAAVFYDMGTGRGFADARLIAAAPGLYDILFEIEDTHGSWLSGNLGKRVRTALAKARGESA